MRRGKWEKGTGSFLICPERVAARPEHMFFQGRNARHVHEHPIHGDGRCQREPSVWIVAGKIDRDDGICDPGQPFEKIVGVARPAPETDVAHSRSIGRMELEQS